MRRKYGIPEYRIRSFFRNLNEDKYDDMLTIGLETRFDMGWQKRSSATASGRYVVLDEIVLHTTEALDHDRDRGQQSKNEAADPQKVVAVLK